MTNIREKLARLTPEQREAVAARIGRRRDAREAAIIPRPSGMRVPLSSVQERLWLMERLDSEAGGQNIAGVVSVSGEFDAQRMQQAMQAVQKKHEILRTAIRSTQGEPEQVVLPDPVTDYRYIDHCSLSENGYGRCDGHDAVAGIGNDITFAARGDGEAADATDISPAAMDLMKAEAARPFDMSSGCLFRMVIIRVSASLHHIMVAMHHMIGDGGSIAILLGEAWHAYGSGPASAMQMPDVQYADYAVWQRRRLADGSGDAGLAYWLTELKGMPLRLDLPGTRNRPLVAKADSGRFPVKIPPDIVLRVQQQAVRFGITPFNVYLAAYASLLMRFTGQQDFAVGVPVSLRNRPELQTMAGCFVNMLPVRMSCTQGASFGTFAQSVSERMLGALQHADTPFEQLVACLVSERDLACTPVFQNVFSFERAPESQGETAGMRWRFSEFALGNSAYDISLELNYGNEDVSGWMDYSRALFDRDWVERFVGCFLRLLASGLEAPDTPLSDLALLDGPERERMLYQFNATQAEYPGQALIHELFEQQVERTPEALAVQYEDESLTYAQLNAKANQLAHRLRAMRDASGAAVMKPDALVAISVERSLEMVVGLLGILKAGAAYVPVDPEYPADRIAYMLGDSQAKVLLTQRTLQERLQEASRGDEEGSGEILLLDDEATYAGQPQDNIGRQETGQTSRHLAYVIYTSGSTGQPKGVMNEHRGVVNRLVWMQEAYGLGEEDRVLQKTPFSFDVSVWEFFWTLLNGAGLVMAAPQGHRDAQYLVDVIERAGVTVVHFVPSMLQVFLASVQAGQCASLRQMVCSGEELPLALQQRCQERLPSVRLDNLYGPTEAAVDVTWWSCDPAQTEGRVPIGRPIANIRMYVLDEQRQPVPLGVAGELYIGGDGVARGYLNRPELTAERFVRDPFSEEAEARMYRTGDLGRWRPDGAIEYLGRNDFQVKIRGQRIELGEIEARLAELPQVREAVVLARQDSPGDQRLVAYWTGRDEGAAGTHDAASDAADTGEGEETRQQQEVARLRDHLKAELPSYMVPGAFVKLDAMPLTPNGKVDRKALPAPDAEALVTHAYEAPQGPVEEVLAGIWQELLGVERVGRHDSFFDLGGHSLLVVSMLEQLRQRGLQVDAQQVFLSDTLSALADEIGGHVADTREVPANPIPEGCTYITPDMLPLVELTQRDIDRIASQIPGGMENIQDIYPLAALQHGILFHHRLDQERDPYVLSAIVSFGSAQLRERFVQAMEKVVARHDALRTAIVWEGLPQAVQVVCRRTSLTTEPLYIAPANGGGDAMACIGAFLENASLGMDLGQPPLVKLRPLRLDESIRNEEGRCFGLILVHHVIADHMSLDVMMQEAAEILEGREAQLEAPVAYRTFVVQGLDGKREADAERFFRQMLGDVDEQTAPFGLADVHGNGCNTEEFGQHLGAELSGRIRACARQCRTSAAALFHVAYGLVLARCAARNDVVFGSVLSGRMGGVAGVDSMVGLFINTLPVRIGLQDVDVISLTRHVQAQLVELLKHEQASLAVAQRCSGLGQGTSLFSAILNYRYNHAVDELAGQLGVSVHVGREKTNYPFDVSVDDLRDGFSVTVSTEAGVVRPERVFGYMVRALNGIVQALEENPHQAAASLDIIPAQEWNDLVYGLNDTERTWQKNSLVHELFEQQVERTPKALAVQYQGESLTYAELNAKANQLAHRLRAMTDESGAPVVGPDTLVAISVERSLEMVVGLLGILKAGAAYVPVDPEYPADRIAHILGDAGARLVLTQDTLKESLPVSGARILSLDDASLYADQPASNIPRALTGTTSSHLAYVIYTSGSTGQPKGVMNEHRGVVNRLCWMPPEIAMRASDRVLQKTSFAFDGSVWELYWTLMHGAAMVLARPGGQRDPGYLIRLIDEEHITMVDFVPSMLQVFLDFVHPGQCRSIRHILCGSEELPLALLQRAQKALPHVRFHNLYGPTEAAADSVYWACDASQTEGRVPIGRPISNIRVHILDGNRQLVPRGVAGELYLGGEGVARGYLNRQALTDERFVADPFSEQVNARLYRTGDLGRWRADGAIEYLGRNDFQVKIRGLRIELGEIEARLCECPSVKEAVVVAREDQPGDRRLVAYWTGLDGEASTRDEACSGEAPVNGVGAIRDHLKAALPEYMVPSAFVRLDVMPLTPNGKVDRKALPAPDAEALVTHAYEAPQGPVEEVLAGIWQELLGVARVGRHDNFFDLGGHSLLMVSLVERLRQHGLKGEISDVFTAPSVSELAKVLRQTQNLKWLAPDNLIPEECQAITPEMLPLVELTQTDIDAISAQVPGGAANIQDIYPLAPLQEGILFHHRLSVDSDAYITPVILGFSSRARFDAFVAALDHVVARHDILRTSIVWDGLPQAVQVVHRHARAQVLPFGNERFDTADDARLALQAFVEDGRFTMALQQCPLVRILLAQPEQGEACCALLLLHHIIDDHVSQGALIDEIVQILSGRSHELPDPVQYRDFVAYSLAHADDAAAEAYFGGLLGDVEEPTAPFGLLDVRGDGRGIRETSLALHDELAFGVRETARMLNVSPAVLFHVAFGLLLAKCGGHGDVVFGSVFSGRMGDVAGAERMQGMFINTLPVRLKLAGQGVAEAVRSTRQMLAGLLAREQTPLAVAQRCSGVPGDLPLFSAILNYRHSTANVTPDLQTEAGIAVIAVQERTNYPLTLSVDDLGTGFSVRVQILAEAKERADRVAHYLLRAMDQMVGALQHEPDRALLALTVLPDEERMEVLHEFNRTTTAYPKDALIHELFEQQVERTPEAVAVQYEGESLTYAALNAKANQLAHWLLDHGAGRGQCVAIVAPRGIPMLLGQLATLKAGGTYVPVDPAFPQERRLFMLQDCRAKVVLSGDTAVEAEDAPAAGQDVQWLDLDHALEAVASLPADNPGVPKAECAKAAYVMYTSGSTGQPKGVMVPHHAISRLVMANGFAELTADDVVVHCSNTAFDASTLEVWGALLNGGRILVVSHDQVLDPVQFGRIMQEGGATVLYLSAGLFNQVAEQLAEVFAQLRYLIVGGDVLDANVIRQVLRNSPPQNLLNGYGPTETTTFAVTCRLNDLVDETTRQVPIGRPIGNTQVYILDGQGQPVPIGVTGEIHIGGDGVALGYLNRPELTAERFIPDPFSEEPDARMYRTGDLGYWRADGLIEFVGRNDFQVKVRGFRIELGEIEVRLGELAEVKEVVVLAREDQPGDKRLVAYWTARDDGAAGTSDVAVDTVAADTADAREDEGTRLQQEVARLREHLRAELPEYMVPSAFVRLEAMPLNTSGKVDRKALPVPDAEALVTHAYEAPQGPVEEVLASIWQELLGVERVGRHDSFFDLGGHSLLAVQLIGRMRRELGQEVALKDFFASPTIAGVAGSLAQADESLTAPIELVDRTKDMALSWAQQRLWFLEQLEDLGGAYHVEGALRLEGELDAAALQAALNAIVARHEVLRTVFARTGEGGEVRQVILPDADFVLGQVDLSGQDGASGRGSPEEMRNARQKALQAVLQEARDVHFDLAHGPLIRGMLIRLGPLEHVLFVSMHHIISDGWSIGVLTREIVTLYTAFRQKETNPVGRLPVLPVQYADYAQWQRQWLAGERLDDQLDFWKGQLAGAPGLLTLPADHPRPGVQRYRGASVHVGLDACLGRQLHALGQRHGATLFMVLQAGFAVLLGRLSGQDDVVIGTPVANRRRSELEGLIGFFVNTLALRTQIDGRQTVAGLLAHVREKTLAAFSHQDAPFEQVVDAVQPERSMDHSPLFQVMLALQNTPQDPVELPGLRLTPLTLARRAAQFDLMLSLQEDEDGSLSGSLEYSTDLFDRETVERWLGYWQRLLQSMVANDGQRIDTLAWMSEPERDQVLYQFNATQAEYPGQALIHELFERQVEWTPEALAVQYEDESLTYAQLNARANQLAHCLRGLKDASGAPLVGPDALVAISVERSLEMVVGLLGILKAGAAYVPVDPEYPADRIAYMLGDSQAKVLLTQRTLQERLQEASRGDEEGSGEILLLDDEATYAGQPQDNIGRQETGQTSRHLAYVIYTSGSTGQPKGVMNEHRGVVNRLVWMQEAYGLGEEDRVLQKTPFSFDVSVWEFFWTLLNGAGLVMAAPQGHRDAQYLVDVIERAGVTVVHFVPSMLQVFLASVQAGQCASLRQMVCSGEELPLALQQRCQERLPSVRLDNLYGPTEAAVDVTWWSCDPAQTEGRVPIGRPIANIRMYVLDEQRQPVPLGVAGELYIGGDGVARGYLNRPELTAERFVRDPFSEEAEARMYRTGDLGRWRPDGAIEYLGRNDFQVKIRGQRIELGEIEARLAELPQVREAVVLARQDSPGDQRLVAYWTGRDEGAAGTHDAASDAADTGEGEETRQQQEVARLRDHLKAELPSYMVPGAFVKLDAMPLTPNGKVDRKALPAPDAEALVTHAYEAPQGPVEEVLAGIWQELLGVERVGRHDSFFDLGGHSLMLTQMVSRIYDAADVEVELADLFSASSLSEMAARVEEEILNQYEQDGGEGMDAG